MRCYLRKGYEWCHSETAAEVGSLNIADIEQDALLCDEYVPMVLEAPHPPLGFHSWQQVKQEGSALTILVNK